MKKEILILGGGLAGLTAGIELVEKGFKVTILERAPKAGGCTASWIDYRDPAKRAYQYPMHMFFTFAVNLFELMKKTGTYENLSPWIPGWHFADKDFKVATLESTPLTKHIPTPFHSLDIIMRFKGMSFLDKISYAPFFFYTLLFGDRENMPWVSDEFNYYGLLKLFGLTKGAINWQREITPSITNLPVWKQTGRKFPILFYLAILRDSDAMKYKLLADDYNPGMIDPMVGYFKKKGGKILFNRLITDVLVENEKVVGVKVVNNEGGKEIVCPNCGAKLFIALREYLCPKCGWRIKNGEVANPIEETFEADYFISTLQPHQLVNVISHPLHPLRKYQYFRNLWEYKGASLSISRIFLKERIVPLEDNYITGLAREWSHFNGAMDISTLMPRYFGPGSVIDILADHGDTLKAYQIPDLKKALLEDVRKLYKVAGAPGIKKQLLANIYPEVLYHIATPNMSIYRPKTQQTPIDNLILAGDWTDYQEIGMEGAVRSGKQAASLILKKEGRPELEILKPDKGFFVSLLHAARDILWKK